MAILNRTLNIVLLLMAIAAAVLSVRLYRLRRELRDRGDALAATVNRSYRHISDQEAELDWKHYHDDQKGFHRDLHTFTGAAEAIRTERDEQIQTIASLNRNLADTKDELAQTNKTLNDARVEIDGLTTVRNQYAAIITGLGQELGAKPETITEESVAAIQSRITKYKHTAAEAEVLRELDIAHNERNEKLQKSVEQLEEGVDLRQRQVDALLGALSAIPPRFVDPIKIRLGKMPGIDGATLIGHIKSPDDGSGNNGGDPVRPLIPLTPQPGEVAKVNYEYNFIIINRGRDSGMRTDLTLTVSRGKEFIAEAVVSRVYNKYAVAEILPNNIGSLVLQDDRVAYLPDPVEVKKPARSRPNVR